MNKTIYLGGKKLPQRRLKIVTNELIKKNLFKIYIEIKSIYEFF